ncbi:MAG TPA: matrixin family metalloprotease [Polyangiaceae bacterium]|nr:matrixin family metalloprotease [Polyangiaceae bacterium]
MVVRGRALGLASAALAFSTMLGASSASAFCRSRACEFDKPASVPCKRDSSGCPTNGAELYWPAPSFDMWVDHKGSPKYGISGEQLLDLTQEALGKWTNVDCSSASPSIAVAKVELMQDDAAVAAGLVQPQKATSTDPAVTTSVVAFIDEGWMKESADAIALTTASFGTQSGRIFGADIELDSTDWRFTLDGDPSPQYDLLSVLTHETGHVFGLADLRTPGPTMYGSYGEVGNTDKRSLETDDEQGMCAIYPPGRFDKDGGCGCRLEGRTRPHPGTWVGVGLAALGLVLRRRRARRGDQGVNTTPNAPPK